MGAASSTPPTPQVTLGKGSEDKQASCMLEEEVSPETKADLHFDLGFSRLQNYEKQTPTVFAMVVGSDWKRWREIADFKKLACRNW